MSSAVPTGKPAADVAATAAVGVIFCAPLHDFSSQTTPFNGEPPPFLLELVDRPFLRHVVESLRSAGVRNVYVVSSEAPERIREILGDGTRWGVNISHHLCRDSTRQTALLATLPIAENATVFVGWGHSCLDFPAADAFAALQSTDAVSITGATTEGEPTAADASSDFAWLCCHQRYLKSIPPDINASTWGGWMSALSIPRISSKSPALASVTSVHLMAAQSDVLQRRFPAQTSGFEAEPGVWLSRNVILHPTATLVAPVFIGEDCRIDAGVTLGPNTSIGKFSRVGKNTSVVGSAISRDSWLGEHMEFRDLMVVGARIWNHSLNTELNIVDAFLLSKMRSERSLLQRLRDAVMKPLRRVFCAIAYILLAPAALLHALFGRSKAAPGVETHIACVKLPMPPAGTSAAKSVRFAAKELAARTQVGTAYFFGWIWPGLLRVALGRQELFGFPPRTAEQCAEMSQHWRDAYGRGSIGVIDPARAEFGAAAQPYECELAELHFAMTPSTMKRGWKLMNAFFVR